MTRTEIVSAAFKVWGRNFYKKTSLSQLASELGVSKPALYRHFKNKHALIDAMTECFFDDLANSIRADYDRARQTSEPNEGIFAIIRGIAGFYAGNVYAFLFSIVNVYDRSLEGKIASEYLKSRGVEMQILRNIIEKKYNADSEVIRLIFPTLFFFHGAFSQNRTNIYKSAFRQRVRKNYFPNLRLNKERA